MREGEREGEREVNEMVPGKSGSGSLLPGLPEELIQAHVLPRLPWYTRPVCRSISKSWRACIDSCKTHSRELNLKTRLHQLPLLRGLCLICTFDTQIFISRERISHEEPKATYFSVLWQSQKYQIHRQWRKLPPLQGLLPQPPAQARLIASSGMVYVWSYVQPTFLLKLDLSCGDWKWNKFPVPYSFNENAVDYNGKIYVPQVLIEKPNNENEEVVLVYDMMTDQCDLLKTWNRDNLRVIPKSNSPLLAHVQEEMYSFVEHESMSDGKLELLVYDALRDSWKTQDEMPIPECRWSELPEVKLVNHDCFEPAPDMGTNTVWIDSEGEVLSWFNPLLHEHWIEFFYNTPPKGKGLEYIQFIRGSLYGVFIEDKEDQDDVDEANQDGQEQENKEGEQDSELYKRTIMKGRMCVASNDVQWEEVHEVGCFEDRYYLQPAVISPIDDYTFMA